MLWESFCLFGWISPHCKVLYSLLIGTTTKKMKLWISVLPPREQMCLFFLSGFWSECQIINWISSISQNLGISLFGTCITLYFRGSHVRGRLSCQILQAWIMYEGISYLFTYMARTIKALKGLLHPVPRGQLKT